MTCVSPRRNLLRALKGEGAKSVHSTTSGGASCVPMTTEEECIHALRTAAEELDRSPSKAQYEELGLTPSSGTIIRTMGGWNRAKELSGLEIIPSRGSRMKPKPADVNLPEGLEWKELSVDQRWHYRNVEWNTERSLRRRARLRTWVNSLKAEYGCSRCSESDPACLDLHHTDDDVKDTAVGRMITNGYGKDRLREEIEKCEVLCANCHRKEHFTPPALDSDDC